MTAPEPAPDGAHRPASADDPNVTVVSPPTPQTVGGTVPGVPPAPSDVSLGLPRVAIPGYEWLARLGGGGMGDVYRARQLALGREVAVKLLRAGAGSARDAARLRREATAIARLRHPNIVQVHEVGEADGQPYLVLELVEGGNLGDALAGAPQAPRETAELVVQLARAVAAAHAAGVIHRDLKPANVLLARPTGSGSSGAAAKPVPKVTDFGLAKLLDDDHGQTHSGDLLGTPAYMAPEQAAGRTREIGPATDVWALGVILYEALTGARPFRAREMDALLASIRDADPPSLAQVLPGVPRDLETICLKCLQKHPGRRYASAADLADDLERYLAGLPVRARRTGTAERAWKWVRRNPLLTGLLGVAALAVCGVALGAVLHVAVLNGQIEETQKAERAARTEAQLKQAALERAEREADDRRRAEAAARRSADERRQSLVALHAAAGRRSATDGDRLAAARSSLEVLRLTEADEPERAARERVRLGALLAHAPRLSCAWTAERPIRHAAFGPDARTVATVGDDGVARLWSADTGTADGAPLVHDGPVRHAVFTPDGKFLVTAAPAAGVTFWNIATRKPEIRLPVTSAARAAELVAALKARTDLAPAARELLVARAVAKPVEPAHLALSADGGRLLVAAESGAHQVWDVVARAPLTPPLMHESGLVKSWPQLSADGKRLAAVTEDTRQGKQGDYVFRVALARLDPLVPVGAPVAFGDASGAPFQLTFEPNGRVLRAGGNARGGAWSALDGEPLAGATTLAGDYVAFDPRGRYEARVGQHGTRVRAARSKLDLFARTQPVDVTVPPAFGPDGALMAVGTTGGLVSVYDWRYAVGGEGETHLRHPAEVTALEIAADGHRLLTLCKDGVVRVWDLAGADGQPTVIETGGYVHSLAWSPDGTVLARAAGTVTAFDPRTGARRWASGRRPIGYNSLEFSATGGRLLGSSPILRSVHTANATSIGWDVWDAATGARVGSGVQVTRPADSNALFATISPDGKRVAWAVGKEPVRVTEVETGKDVLEKSIPNAGGAGIESLAFSPDGTRLAVASGGVRVYEVPSGTEGATIARPPVSVNRLAFSPDGRKLLVGRWVEGGIDDSEALTVYDAGTGGALMPELVAFQRLTHAAFRPPHGDQVLVAAFDGTVRCWDLKAGRLAWEQQHARQVAHASYSPDGRWVGYTTAGVYSHLRDADTGEPLAPPMRHATLGRGFDTAFGPGAARFAVAAEGGIVVWELAPDARPLPVLEEYLAAAAGRASAAETVRAVAAAPPDLRAPPARAALDWHRAQLRALTGTEDLASAACHLDRLLAAAPRDGALLLARAKCSAANGRWTAVLADLDALDGDAVGAAAARLLRGRARFELGEPRGALAHFEAVLSREPKNTDARALCGRARLALGDWNGAYDDLATVLSSGASLDPPEFGALVLAVALADRKPQFRPEQYAQLFAEKIGAFEEPEVAGLVARVLGAVPNPGAKPDAVARVARRAAAFDPVHPANRYALGLAEHRAGNAAVAMRELLAAERSGAGAVRLKARFALALVAPTFDGAAWALKARADRAAAEKELAEGRGFAGTDWAEVELLSRAVDARFKTKE